MRFLFFEAKYLCHKTNEFFIEKISGELEGMGHEVYVLSLINRENMEERLNSLIGQRFDAIIDFNSFLPTVENEEGGLYLDSIEGPFIHYIVDHPLFHHESMKMPVKDYYVVCIDNNHKKYIDKHYKNIKRTRVLPLAPSPAFMETGEEDKEIDVLYPVSYMTLTEANERIDRLEPEIAAFTRRVAEVLLSSPELTIEEAVHGSLWEEASALMNRLELLERDFIALLFMADIYARCVVRERVLTALLNEGLSVLVCGPGWEEYKAPDGAKLKIIEDVDYSIALTLMQQSKAVVNVSPGFKCAVHDRLSSALLNGALAVTDNSIREGRYDDKDYFDFSTFAIHNEGLIWYDYTNDSIKEMSRELADRIKNYNKLSDVLRENASKTKELYGWKELTERLVSFVSEINSR